METSKGTVYYKNNHEAPISRVSWPAIFAGTTIMLITLMLLSLLGIGVGLGAINPAEEVNPMEGIGTGTLIWWVISNLIAVFAGAYVAAQLANVNFKFAGIFHGILSWSLYALISFWMMTTAVGGVISGAGGIVSKGLTTMGSGVSELASSVGQGDTDKLKQMIQQSIAQEKGQPGDTIKKFDIDVMAVVQDVFFENGQFRTNVQREEVERSVARNSTLSKEDANAATDAILGKYEEAKLQWQEMKPKIKQEAQQVAGVASKASIWSFVALLLGLITAGIGGRAGEPKEIYINDRNTNV